MEFDQSVGSFKSLENVCLKTTCNIEAAGKSYDAGEIIAKFDKIQISGLREFRDYVAARGGFDNRGWVYWTKTQQIDLTFSQGVFSSLQFGLLNNANIIRIEEEEPLLITKVEELESDAVGNVVTSKEPYDQIFVYDKSTGEKIHWFKLGTFLRIDTGYTDVVVSYRYNYTQGATIARIGEQFTNGFLELEGITRVKDDTSGLITTGVIKIPKLKLMSGLSIQLGAQANPVVGNFRAVGVPVGSRNDSYVVEFDFLEHDIDSDM